jgi:tetratricopeptide (TPR) repeat protein
MMRTLVIALVIALLCASLASRAHADGKADARPHVVAADTAYKLGKFDDALAEYSKAYELFPAPPILFNLGQCQMHLQHWERAIFFYEGYLRARPDAGNRAVVEDLLREAHAKLDDEARDREAKRLQDEAMAADKARAAETERLRVETQLRQEEEVRAAAERQRLADQQREIVMRRAEEQRAQQQPIYRKWWFLSLVGSAALVAGGATYYFADTKYVQPSGTLGGLNRQ